MAHRAGCPVQSARLALAVRGARVLRSGHAFAHVQQRGVAVPGGGRVPRLPGPAGEVDHWEDSWAPLAVLRTVTGRRDLRATGVERFVGRRAG